MKYTLLIFSILIPIFIYAEEIKLATYENPPLEFSRQGKPHGLAVEVVKSTFAKMNRKINIAFYPFKRGAIYLKRGKVDAIFTFFKNSKREGYADYSRVSLFTQTTVLFVLKNSKIKYAGDLKTISNHSFGVVRGYSYGDIFDNAIEQGLIKKLDPAKNLKQNVNKFLAGRFDILVGNKYCTLDMLTKMGKKNTVIILPHALQKIESYIAFSKVRNLKLLRDEFDKTLSLMKANGEYNKIILRYTGSSPF